MDLIIGGRTESFNCHVPPKAEQRHTNLVKSLELKLFEKIDYDSMNLFVEYCRNGQMGEIDLLAVSDDIFDFYEVKCSDCNKSRKKANEQYLRFMFAFPEVKTNGYFYAGGKIKRI